MSQVSIVEAKNALTRLIYKAQQGEDIHITRHGRPVAVLISQETYDRLQAGAPLSLWQAIQSWRDQSVFDVPELTPEEVDRWRDRSPGRVFSWED